jgi:hypothetical protein
MFETTCLSFRVPKAKVEQLQKLAGPWIAPNRCSCKRPWMDLKAWHMAYIEQGRRELPEGRGIRIGRSVRWVKAWTGGADGEINPREYLGGEPITAAYKDRKIIRYGPPACRTL